MITMVSADAPLIRRLTIERFRGIEKLVWYPEPGVNVVLGGGDAGKTTILDAIALLLSPTNTAFLSDADYFGREVDQGFCVEAVMSLPETSGINAQTKNVWPWEWNGEAPTLPNVDADPSATNIAEPVYCLRVRGTAEFDLAFEVFQPDGTADHLSVAVRRKIGLVRLGGDDRNDRDLRLVQGSALERLLADKTLRARLGQKLAENDIADSLQEEAKAKLALLDQAFEAQTLPHGLSLGLTGGQGLSLNALVGLTAKKNTVQLPLASWGAGTRRLAALEIAATHQGENPITVVDEIERGLEPYRQRALIAELQQTQSQIFLTTHSAAALRAAVAASLWYVDSAGNIGRLPKRVTAHQKRDPETFLARIAIIAEGPTEVGFVSQILQIFIGEDLLNRGIWISDGCGNDQTLQLLESLVDSGLMFAGFADDEGRDPGRWATVQSALGSLLFRWPTGSIEANIIALVPDGQLEEFIKDSDGDAGDRLRTLADRLEITDKSFSTIKAKTFNLKALIVEAATGTIPSHLASATKAEKKTLRSHGQKWFKSTEGGVELASKVIEFDLLPQLDKQLLPFINAVRNAISLPPLTHL